MKVNKRNKRVVIYQRSPDPRERTHFPASRSGIITPRSFHSQSTSIANIYQLNLKCNLKEHRQKTVYKVYLFYRIKENIYFYEARKSPSHLHKHYKALPDNRLLSTLLW